MAEGLSGQQETSTSTVRISNLDFSTTEKDLHDFFAQCGDVVTVKWGFDDYRKAFLGYADVQFEARCARMMPSVKKRSNVPRFRSVRTC